MTRLTSPHLRARPIALALVGAVSCWSTASLAQSAPEQAAAPATLPPSSDVRRLTDEQRREIEDNNTEEKAAAIRGELAGSRTLAPGIHGEIGAMIGSHGTRGIYGTAEIPLGDKGAAMVSFESSRFGYRR